MMSNTTTATTTACISSAEERDAAVHIQVIEIGRGHAGGLGGAVNSLGVAVCRQLRNDVLQALEEDAVHGIVLVGHGGKHFSAGADIREFSSHHPTTTEDVPTASPSKYDHEAYTNPSPSIVDVCHVLCHSDKPVVAAIRGACLGGGLEVALSCDYRVVCSRSSSMGLPETQIGLLPGAGGTQRLPRLVGVPLALQLITSGKAMGPAEAAHMKLVDDVVVAVDKNKDKDNNNEEPRLVTKAVQWAKWACALGPDVIRQTRKLHLRPVPGRRDQNVELCKEFAATKLPKARKGGMAVQAAVKAVQAAVTCVGDGDGVDGEHAFEKGRLVEEELFLELLLQSQQGRALRHAFFAQRAVQAPWGKGKGQSITSTTTSTTTLPLPSCLTLKEITTIGIVGAGTMGQGIAISFLRAGFAVVLVDVNPTGLERGVKAVHSIMAKKKKSKSSSSSGSSSANPNKLLLSSGTSLQSLKDCHVVIEAVFEKLSLKKQIFKDLNTIVKHPHALLLTNTSTLDVQSIMEGISQAQSSNNSMMNRLPYCAGMHFFSPAHVMKLVEVIYVPSSGAGPQQTSPETIQLMQALVKRIGKVGVVMANGPTLPVSTATATAIPSSDADKADHETRLTFKLPPRVDGFVGNRMVFPYSTEPVLMLMEQPNDNDNNNSSKSSIIQSPKDIDAALQAFGMPIGPLMMGDLAGNDIGHYIRQAKGLVDQAAQGQLTRYPSLADDLVVNLKRMGQKMGKGWYTYDPRIANGRAPLPSSQVQHMIDEYRLQKQQAGDGAVTKPIRTPDQIVQQCLYPLVNEGFKILQEGIVQHPSEIDITYIYGYGFPAWRGGPMFWADQEVGLANLLKVLQELHRQYPSMDYFKPATLLQECVARNVTVHDYFNNAKHRKQPKTTATQGRNQTSKL
jgi:enoyl-CoA hydratase/3-hydroxyacyl-CoA dehydrogenase/3,2-trans-enoyl-CoA isomerase